MRDLDANPYSEDEKRVADYVYTLAGLGGGDDPIGFMLASNAMFTRNVLRYRDALELLRANFIKWEIKDNYEKCKQLFLLGITQGALGVDFEEIQNDLNKLNAVQSHSDKNINTKILFETLQKARQYINDFGPDLPGEQAAKTNDLLTEISNVLNAAAKEGGASVPDNPVPTSNP